MTKHISDYKQYLQGIRRYTTSFKIIENKDYYIELIEQKECNNKDELNQLEGKYIKQIDCVNKIVPGRTRKQYYEDNQDNIKMKTKQYYKNNEDKIKEQTKQYYKNNKDKMKQIFKQYYKINKDKIKQKNENNKDKIKEKMSKKYICSCGSNLRIKDKVRHEKSKKHQKYIN